MFVIVRLQRYMMHDVCMSVCVCMYVISVYEFLVSDGGSLVIAVRLKAEDTHTHTHTQTHTQCGDLMSSLVSLFTK